MSQGAFDGVPHPFLPRDLRRRDQLAILLLDLRHMNADWDSSPRSVLLGSLPRVLVHGRYRGLVWYRLSQLLPQTPASWCASRCLRACGAEISPRARLGAGLELKHSAGIVVGPDVTAGSGLTLYQGVTLGHGKGEDGMPALGRRVTVYAGATILGPVTVGDGATIGAGALVLADVPEGQTVTGTWK
jgi:serine O-acetyltransferase